MRLLKRLVLGLSITVITLGMLIAIAARPADVDIAPDGIRHFVEFAAPPPALPPQSLRIVTYNIGYAYADQNNTGNRLTETAVRKNLDAMITALSDLQPDVIGLQEVDFAAHRTHYIDQLAYLAHGLKMPFAAYAVTWNRRYVPWPYWPPSRHFRQVVSGQAVLSRYPIVAQTIHHFAKPASNPFWYNLFYLDRLAQRVTVQVGPQPAIFWHVHLEAFDESTRHGQLQTLATLARQEGAPHLWVLGDFNSESHAVATIEFGNATQLQNVEFPGMTYSVQSWSPAGKIDHIFSRRHFPITTAGTATQLLASDHIPVWAEVGLAAR